MHYIVTHRDIPGGLIDDAGGTLISTHPIKNESKLPLVLTDGRHDGRVFSEWAAIKHIRDERPAPWITISHYRRIFAEHRVPTVAFPIYFVRMKVVEQYAKFHNVNDLVDCAHYVPAHALLTYLETLDGNYLVPFNIVSMPWNLYCDWVDFVWSTITAWLEGNGLKTYDDLLVRCAGQPYAHMRDARYQARIAGFLAERLSTCWVKLHREQISFGAVRQIGAFF